MAIHQLYTIPFSSPFMRSFVARLLNGDIIDGIDKNTPPQSLADITIFVPTQRAGKALKQEFLYQVETQAVLLPHIIALGSIDQAQEILIENADLDWLETSLVIPPQIPSHQRLLILARLIRSWALEYRSNETLNPDDIGNDHHRGIVEVFGHNIAGALSLARKLASLMDQMDHYEVQAEHIVTLLNEQAPDLQIHWEMVASFIQVITKAFPDLLQNMGYSAPIQRQKALFSAFQERLKRRKWDGALIWLGSLGEQPIARKLAATIANHPQGAVVLRGLDHHQSEDVFYNTHGGVISSPSHPQHAMMALLEEAKLHRHDFKTLLPLENQISDEIDLDWLLSLTMIPASYSDIWSDELAYMETRLGSADMISRKLKVLEVDSDHALARSIALKLAEFAKKHAAYSDDKTLNNTPPPRAVLISPDRSLSKRTSIELKRWQIEVDDTAGQTMMKTPAGVFFRLIAQLAGENFAPIPLLALLSHPLMSLSKHTSDTRNLVRKLEIEILRGPKIAIGLEPLKAAILEKIKKLQNKIQNQSDVHFSQEHIEKNHETYLALLNLVESLQHIFAPILTLKETQTPHPLSHWFEAHIQVLQNIETLREQDRIFAYEDGIALLAEIQDIKHAATLVPVELTLNEYPHFIEMLMQDRPVRERRPKHPQIFIMGPLEARLQDFDLVIMAGLNEGIWPRQTMPGPFMSRPMRTQIGLFAPEYEIGLSAHDFCQGFSGKEIWLARSKKVDGSPIVPSRWWQRMMALLPKTHIEAMQQEAIVLNQMAQALDNSQYLIPNIRPAPRPPSKLRPRAYWATRVETLAKDPYQIFARYILKLKALDELGQTPNMGDKGSIIHHILSEYYVRHWQKSHKHDVNILIEIGRKAFESLILFPHVYSLWWPRFEKIAHSIILDEHGLDKDINAVFSEVVGHLDVTLPSGEIITLSARADRIDYLNSGNLQLIDFKTGNAPSSKQILEGHAIQMPLEAYIVQNHGFDEALKPALSPLDQERKIENLYHYVLKGQQGEDKVEAVFDLEKLSMEDIKNSIDEIAVRAFSLIDASLEESWAYNGAISYQENINIMNDYHHLSRIDAWLAFGEESQSDEITDKEGH